MKDRVFSKLITLVVAILILSGSSLFAQGNCPSGFSPGSVIFTCDTCAGGPCVYRIDYCYKCGSVGPASVDVRIINRPVVIGGDPLQCRDAAADPSMDWPKYRAALLDAILRCGGQGNPCGGGYSSRAVCKVPSCWKLTTDQNGTIYNTECDNGSYCTMEVEYCLDFSHTPPIVNTLQDNQYWEGPYPPSCDGNPRYIWPSEYPPLLPGQETLCYWLYCYPY